MSKPTLFRGSIITALVVGTSIWASVAIPNRNHAAARAQIANVLTNIAVRPDACATPSATTQSPYVGRLDVNQRTCAVSIMLKSTAPVAPALRGTQLSLRPRQGRAPAATGADEDTASGWHCEARGGHGASQADFPNSCRFYTEDLLL